MNVDRKSFKLRLTNLPNHLVILKDPPSDVYAVVVPIGPRHLLVDICINSRHDVDSLVVRREPLVMKGLPFSHENRISTDIVMRYYQDLGALLPSRRELHLSGYCCSAIGCGGPKNADARTTFRLEI